MPGVLIRSGKYSQRHRGRVKTEAEMGVMLPRANKGLGLPEVGTGRKESSPRGFRGNTALPTP